MTRDAIVDLVKKFYTNQIDVVQFLVTYAKHRGKTDMQMYELFLQTAMFRGAIPGLLEYAINWYKGEYNVFTIWKIDKNNNKIFITAY